MTEKSATSNPVVIVDYGLGNLGSVARAVRHLGAESLISSDPEVVYSARRLVLPGVGAFGTAMTNLRSRGLIEPLQAVAAAGRPMMGLCLGMQLFMDESDEGAIHRGLSLIPGSVTRLAPGDNRYKVPHIGWSGLEPGARSWSGTALDSLKPNDALYFVHSYYVTPADPEDALAYTSYGSTRYCSVIARGNIVGCQAHPEKSSNVGLKILQNFLTATTN
jgi:imidazole glycerol-phosphate synthase subunit HisH